MKTPMVDDQNHYKTIPIGSMYAIFCNIYYQYTVPQMLAYIPAPWILWVMILEVPICSKCIQLLSLLKRHPTMAHGRSVVGIPSDDYPLVNIQKAMENGHRNSEFSHETW